MQVFLVYMLAGESIRLWQKEVGTSTIVEDIEIPEIGGASAADRIYRLNLEQVQWSEFMGCFKTKRQRTVSREHRELHLHWN